RWLRRPRPLAPRAPAFRPRRAVAPVEPRALLRVVGVVALAGGLVLAHRGLARLHRPVVLLALPFPAAGMVEDGDARKIARPAPRRVIAAVLDVQDDAAPLGIDHVPLVARVDLAVLLHERHKPRPDRLEPVHYDVLVLEVGPVLGVESGHSVPVSGN